MVLFHLSQEKTHHCLSFIKRRLGFINRRRRFNKRCRSFNFTRSLTTFYPALHHLLSGTSLYSCQLWPKTITLGVSNCGRMAANWWADAIRVENQLWAGARINTGSSPHI